ncbi:MAG: UDP-N-acetylglucosamine--LPS N-acetylglucosamine transferase [Candidatus Electrothrix sp. GM3_4]|nr:UDP-N-acetylglucosamine--LPS N-acetylglucosamine transferase [Candidatus Electrothrix sp. GM3_4]
MKKKIMLVASSGGHWIQLNRLTSVFENNNHDLLYVTTLKFNREQVNNNAFFLVPDADRRNKLKIVMLAWKMFWLLVFQKPNIVISTGALPGFFAIFFGKKMGAKTIWLDSIANSQKLSMSGEKAGKYADLWLTQWEHLAQPEGPHYYGAII